MPARQIEFASLLCRALNEKISVERGENKMYVELFAYIGRLIFLPLSMFLTVLSLLFPGLEPIVSQIIEAIIQFTTVQP